MKCKNCSTEIPAGARFCPSCGLLTNIYIDFREEYHPAKIIEYINPRKRERTREEEDAAEEVAATENIEIQEEREAEEPLSVSAVENNSAKEDKEDKDEEKKEAVLSAESAVKEEELRAEPSVEVEDSEKLSEEKLRSEIKTSVHEEALPDVTEEAEEPQAEERAETLETQAEVVEEAEKEKDVEASQTEAAKVVEEPETEAAEEIEESQEEVVKVVEEPEAETAEEIAEESEKEKVETAEKLETENTERHDSGEAETDAENVGEKNSEETENTEEEEEEKNSGDTEADAENVEDKAKLAEPDEKEDAESGEEESKEEIAEETSVEEDVMIRLAAEIEKRKQEKEEEELRLLEESVLRRVRELTGIQDMETEAQADFASETQPQAARTTEIIEEGVEEESEIPSTSPVNGEDVISAEEASSEEEATETDAVDSGDFEDFKASEDEEAELREEEASESTAEIRNIRDYQKESRREAPLTESGISHDTEAAAALSSEEMTEEANEETGPEAEAENIIPMEEITADEDSYTGPDQSFEEMATMPPDPENWGKAVRKNRGKLAAVLVALGLLTVPAYYLNTPGAVENRLYDRGEKLFTKQDYEGAVSALTELLEKNPGRQDAYLLLSTVFVDAGRHEDAVELLKQAEQSFPENAELSEALRGLNPKVTASVEQEAEDGRYTDPVEITLSNVDKHEIRYSLKGGDIDIVDEPYQKPIRLSINGSYELSAYAIASDQKPGEILKESYVLQLNPEKYHLNDWQDTEAGRIYLTESGARAKGWLSLEDKNYYFDENGILLTGLQTIGNDQYYFDGNGVMQTGWVDLDGQRYFFDSDGKMMKSAWIDESYYVGDDGVMLRDTTIDGVYVDQNGSRSFLAKAEYESYPNSIVHVNTRSRVDKGEYFEISGELYHEKSNGRPSGKKDRDVLIKLRKDAMQDYLDGGLISIQARDAVHFLPDLYMQNIEQNEDGEIVRYSILLGEDR